MPFTILGRDRMLGGLFGQSVGSPVAFASLHQAPPTEAGLYELSGGAPAYARKAVSLGSPSNGSISGSASVVFDVPTGSTAAFMGLWTAATNGDFMGWTPTNGGGTASGAIMDGGTDVFSSPAHGLLTNDRVILLPSIGSTALPAGLSRDVLYYVVGATTDTFQVSLTIGGAAVDAASSGAVVFQKVVPDAFSVQATLTISAFSFILGV